MQTDNILQVFTAKRHTNPHYQCQLEHRASGLYTAYTHCANSACHHPTDSAAIHRPRLAISHNNLALNRCSKLIAIKLCAISEMHAKVRRESVAGYATDETLVCGPKEHTRWWQRYGRHLQGLLYRLILNSYLSSFVLCWQKHQPLPNRQPTASLRHSRGEGSRQRRLLTSMTLSSITASPHS